jgi:hypothetical protein
VTEPSSGSFTTEQRTVTVPEGLAGERVDSAIARMFGLSRTRAAELIRSGHVSVDGEPPAKSDRVEPGSMLDVSIPAVADPVAVAWPRPASGSPPAGRPSGRASCSGSTWAPPG